MKLLTGNSNRPLSEAIGQYLHVPFTKGVVRRFADMEVFVEIEENVRGEDMFVIQSTSFPANDNLMELLIMIDALKRAERYSSIINEGVLPKCIDRKSVGISFHYVGVSRHLDRHQVEFWMVAFVRTCRQLTGLRLLPSCVRMIHHRAQNTEFAEYLGDNIEFGATADEIIFSDSIRQSPIVSADPYLNNVLIGYCEDAISHRKNRGSFQSNVENAIVPLLPHGKARAGEIAHHLRLSPRTFARRLSLEGLTFSELLEGLRSDLANRYLADRDLAISEIAWLLGYREVSSFSHAFKRWTGKTPREARSP
jgi:AraC-like DNA-binding protein